MGCCVALVFSSYCPLILRAKQKHGLETLMLTGMIPIIGILMEYPVRTPIFKYSLIATIHILLSCDLDNQGDVQSEKPFIHAISTPSLTEVLITFDKEMDVTTAGQASNYSINNGISVSNAIFNSSNPTEVLLEVSTLTEN